MYMTIDSLAAAVSVMFLCIQVPTTSTHTVRWLIQDYEDLTTTEGDAVTFIWDGFHSLHQVNNNCNDYYSGSDNP